MDSAATTRERILKATFELVSSSGYTGSTTRKIAQRAGVAEVTLFRHFANKESLFTELLRSFSSAPALSELVQQLKLRPFEEALKALTVRFLEHTEVNRNWGRILNFEVGYAPEEMKNVYGDFLRQVFRDLTVFFTDAHVRGAIRQDLDPEHAARAFHSMVFGFFHIEGLLEIDIDPVTAHADMVDAFVDIFCKGTKTLD